MRSCGSGSRRLRTERRNSGGDRGLTLHRTPRPPSRILSSTHAGAGHAPDPSPAVRAGAVRLRHRAARDMLANAEPVTRTETNGDVITEYRVAGALKMVKVMPFRGPTYYVYDRDGDGKLDWGKGEAPMTYTKLYSWWGSGDKASPPARPPRAHMPERAGSLVRTQTPPSSSIASSGRGITRRSGVLFDSGCNMGDHLVDHRRHHRLAGQSGRRPTASGASSSTWWSASSAPGSAASSSPR